MGKISPVSAKYIIHAHIEIEGVVDRPDVIGAIFGQTEGLLGADLELRELQRSGRIGRIEVNVDTRGGKTQGAIIIPSSLDKAETSIVAAAMEIIQRIGPCNAKLKVEKIEDVRVSKRSFVIERAKELLRTMMDQVMPDSQELADEVAYSVRVMEIREYGKDRLPAGPAVDESEDVIVVEGRADVLNLLKHGFKNVIALNGTSVPQTIIDLSHKKEMTVFVDGDRGGDLIIKELMEVAEIDFVSKAPAGKEVEEITKKEIHKALRGRVVVEQVKLDTNGRPRQEPRQQFRQDFQRKMVIRPMQSQAQAQQAVPARKVKMNEEERAKFRSILEDLIGTRAAFVFDAKMNILGKVPISELATTMKSLNAGVYAIILDGAVDRDIVGLAEKAKVQYLIGMEDAAKMPSRVNVLTVDDL
ncbi:DNA primase [Candidatus Woesearchaeota archaeon]|nr:DNA primase [Candidatus Woesearchaeota archaeon]